MTQFLKMYSKFKLKNSTRFISFTICLLVWTLISFNLSVQSLTENRLKNIDFKSLINHLNHYELIRFVRDGQTQPINASTYRIVNNMLVADLHAFGQHFPIIAYRTSQQHVNLDSGRRKRRHALHFYQGRLRGQTNSFVQLYVWNDRLIGHIKNDADYYQLEVLHHQDDVNRKPTRRDTKFDAPTVLIYRKRDLKAEPIENESSTSVQELEHHVDDFFGPLRKRNSNIPSPKIKKCRVKITVDHKLYKVFRKNKDIIANEMHLLVLMLNQVYKRFTILNEQIMFEMQDILVLEKGESSEDPPGLYLKDYDIRNGSRVLNFFNYNIQNYCASLLISGRDFGTVGGIAWVKSNDLNGLCAGPTLAQNENDVSPVLKSFNTAFITLARKNGLISRPRAVSVLAHEVNKNFGAPLFLSQVFFNFIIRFFFGLGSGGTFDGITSRYGK